MMPSVNDAFFRKLMIAALVLLISFGAFGCEDEQTTTITTTISSEDDQMTPVSTIETTTSGKTYFSVRNKPFLMLGTQIRLDGLLNRPDQETHETLGRIPDPLSLDEVEGYFREAADFGFNTVQVPIDWRWIEPEKDVYDFQVLDRMLSYADTYQLKMEILWFSTNMCGDSHAFHLPDYIFWDKETYPRIQVEISEEYVDEFHTLMYGHSGYLVLNHPELMEREAKALRMMMNHVAHWNAENGLSYPVIGVQIHNESDGFLRWRLNQGNLKLNGEALTKQEAWEMTLEALDHAGQAVKNSEYVVVTRANMTVSLSMDAFPQYSEASPRDVLELQGIDIVGDDPYVETPGEIKQSIMAYKSNGNYPHIAENMGNYSSTPALMLTAIVLGGSYNVYDFATPEYFVWMNQGSDYQMDQGILNPDFTEKEHSPLTSMVLQGIRQAGSLFSLIKTEDIAGFNLSGTLIRESITQTINTTRVSFTFKTDNKALAYAIVSGEHIYVWGSSDYRLKMENVEISPYADTGYMSDGAFVSEGKIYPSGEFMDLSGNVFYRFSIRSAEGQLNSSTIDAIG